VPYLYHSLFPSRHYQVFALVEDSVEYLTVCLHVGLGSVAEDCLEVRERPYRTITVVFISIAILQNLFDFELETIGAFHYILLEAILDYSFESVLL
jgi:hypothetical protein